MRFTAYGFIAAIVLVWSVFSVFPRTLADDGTRTLPQLYTARNHLYRSDTGEVVVLRGAVSDFFRYGDRFGTSVRAAGMVPELTRVAQVHAAGGNVMGLYLADTDAIETHLADLDAYVEFALAHGMYVYFMPVAREFNGRQDPADASRNLTYDDLRRLLEMLSKHYAGKTNVLYGLGAEPEGETAESWDKKERDLAAMVRSHAPNAIIMVTGSDYGYGFTQHFLASPFPYTNILYAGGGYMATAPEDLQGSTTLALARMVLVERREISAAYPYIASEFGGFSSHGLSSAEDLSYVSRLLAYMGESGVSYTFYRLSGDLPDDKLAIFDHEDKPTARGKLFLQALRMHPPTKF